MAEATGTGGGGFWDFLQGGSPLAFGAMGLGQGLIGGLASLLHGPSEQEKYYKQAREQSAKTFNYAQNQLAQPAIDPKQYFAQMQRAIAPQVGERATAIDKRLGLDSGVAQGELWGDMFSQLGGWMLDAQMQAQQQYQQRQLALLSLMGNVSRV